VRPGSVRPQAMAIYDLVQSQIEEEDLPQQLLDFVSEGEGEELDSIEAPVKLDASFPNTVVIVGLPKVGKEKYDKLMNVLNKLIDK
ncbi:unnamed protein product, partial [Polarella glacialis]